MNYEEAKVYQQQLEDKNKAHSDTLKEFDKYRNEMGITPDHIRATSEWQKAKRDFDNSFAQLREFNGWFVKTFKKEYAADRRKRIPIK
jgi:hypothetical protein